MTQQTEKRNTPILLPDLGDVEDVRIVAWLAPIGGTVSEGEDLLEVETEKTTFVVPAPAGGVLRRIDAAEGTTTKRGEILGEIEADA